ncbi:hypothetical protein [Methanobacterium sp. MZD130B]|uniref:hypothetical protein n=1 Tax=Methanobacterium sp. MZD130B TaxID=3394378 RepID=UPI0039FCE38C
MKNTVVLIIGLILFISGCINTNSTYETWGQKHVSIDLISFRNSTPGEHTFYKENLYYVIEGYLLNKNPHDALSVKINVTGYDSNGTIVVYNSTPEIYPKVIPGKGKSRFYARLLDPDKKVVRYDVKIFGAKSEY